jgi:ADP-ribose pyrophosphatase
LEESILVEKILARQTRFKGRLLQLETLDVERIDGRPAGREVVHSPNAVCAAVFTRDREWVFVRQYRVAAESLLLEVAGGRIDPGEDPDQAIERELREEVGYQSGRILPLMQFWSTPGFCTQRMTCYLVDEAELGDSRPDEGEFLEIVRVGAEEGLAMVTDGRIADGASVAVVLAAARKLGL